MKDVLPISNESRDLHFCLRPSLSMFYSLTFHLHVYTDKEDCLLQRFIERKMKYSNSDNFVFANTTKFAYYGLMNQVMYKHSMSSVLNWKHL
jgi:hypothetical protein